MLDIDYEKLGLSAEQKAAIEQAATSHNEGLVSKRDELLGKLTTLQKASGTADSELERLRQLEQNIAVQDQEAKKNYDEALRLATEANQKTVDDLTAKLTAADGTISGLVVDKGLSDALDSINVHQGLKEAATALMKQGVEVKDGKAWAGDKLLADHIAEWSKTDAAKAFIRAPDNSGGGANGSGNSSGTTKSFQEMGTDERTHLFKTNPDEYKRIRDSDQGKANGHDPARTF
jgi:hypothetical protein